MQWDESLACITYLCPWNSFELKLGTDSLHLKMGLFCIWRRKYEPTPVFMPGKSHGVRSLVGYSPWGRKESDMTEPFPFTSLFCIRPSFWPVYHGQSDTITFTMVRCSVSTGAPKQTRDYLSNRGDSAEEGLFILQISKALHSESLLALARDLLQHPCLSHKLWWPSHPLSQMVWWQSISYWSLDLLWIFFLLCALLKTGSFTCYLVILIGGRWCKAQRLFSLWMIYPPVVYTTGFIDQSDKPLITHGVYFHFQPIWHARTIGRHLSYFYLLSNTSSQHAVIKLMNQSDASWDSRMTKVP